MLQVLNAGRQRPHLCREPRAYAGWRPARSHAGGVQPQFDRHGAKPCAGGEWLAAGTRGGGAAARNLTSRICFRYPYSFVIILRVRYGSLTTMREGVYIETTQ